MLVRIKVGGELVEVNTSSKRSYIFSLGESKYYAGRLTYYLLKTINNIPRLYGYIKGDPINGWRETFERTFLNLITLDLDVAKNWFKGAIQGSFANCNISVDLDLFNGGITEYI